MIRPANRPLDDRGGLDWFGAEFLTWLWWRSVTAPEFRRPASQPGAPASVYVHFDDHLELRGERAAAKKTTLRSGAPAASAEGRAALRSGKAATAARVILARGEEEVTLTIRAEDLDVSAARLPAGDASDPEERLAESLSAARRAYEDLDACFQAFLDVRCSDRWHSEAAAIRAWARSPSPEERAPGV
jgi:hypothetical protein